jgi:hypothetical protein
MSALHQVNNITWIDNVNKDASANSDSSGKEIEELVLHVPGE